MTLRAAAGIAGLLLAGCATVPAAPPRADAAPAVVIARPTAADQNATFEKIGRSYIDILTAENPVRATELGDHRHDGELPAIDASARKTRVAMDNQFLQALGQIDPSRLTPDNQLDYALLKNALEYDLWTSRRCRPGRGIRKSTIRKPRTGCTC